MIFNGQSITPKQTKIILILFQYRGMRYDQLLLELASRMQREVSVSFRKNTYKDLQRLEAMKLIIRDPLKISRSMDFIYLSEAGLECASELLEIPVGHVGTGWDRDWGDFPYELHRPPRTTSAVIHHHLMLTDVLLSLQDLGRQNSSLGIDYRDNRYCSVEFQLDGGTYRFKPDADFILGNGERYLIEVDRGTEFGDKLREKFKSYDSYFKHLRGNGEPLPDGVIFVMNKSTPNGMVRRWSLIAAAFLDTMQEWSTNFNLIGSSVVDAQKIIKHQFIRSKEFKIFYRELYKYATTDLSVGCLKEGQGIPWQPAPYTLLSSEQDNKLFVFERCEPFETIGLARIHAWWKWHIEAKKRYSDIAKVKDFIPVLWRPSGYSYPLQFKGWDIESELNVIFSKQLWVRMDGHLEWYLSNGQQLRGANPMVQFPIHGL